MRLRGVTWPRVPATGAESETENVGNKRLTARVVPAAVRTGDARHESRTILGDGSHEDPALSDDAQEKFKLHKFPRLSPLLSQLFALMY